MYERSWLEPNITLPHTNSFTCFLAGPCPVSYPSSVLIWPISLHRQRNQKKNPLSNSKPLQLVTPNSFEGEQIVIYSSCSKFLLNCTKSCMTSQDNTSNWMLHEKTTVVMFRVFGKSVHPLGREEGLIKSPLKPTRKILLASLGFSSAFMEQVLQLDLCSYNLPAIKMPAAPARTR